MEITIKIDKRTKQAKAVLEMLKTFDFVTFVNNDKEKTLSEKKKKSIEEISKEINKAGTKKAFAELGLDYDSYSRQ